MTNKTIYDLLDEYAEANQDYGDMRYSHYYSSRERKEQEMECEKVRKEICDWLFINSN